MLAVAEGRKALDAELAGQRREPVLRRPDPLPARLDDLAGVIRREILVERPPADPVASLEHHDPLPRAREIPSGHEPREPGPGHHDIDVVHQPIINALIAPATLLP